MQFKVRGQGVFLFTSLNHFCSIKLYNKQKTNGLSFNLEETVKVNYIPSNEPLVDRINNEGIFALDNIYYWISLDSQNQKINVGIGEPRIETSIYTYTFGKEQKSFLESITEIVFGENVKPINVLKDPITISKLPMLVKMNMTLHSIAKGDHLPHSNLTSIGQRLYNCISGESFVLNEPDFRNFGKAIEKSVKTPKHWCYEKLKAKANEFGNDPKMSYLRITMGQNNGESPGMEYVMEIWPEGHYSPIHNHAGANAIIKVLRGKINVKLFPFLNETVKPFASPTIEKGDITWISQTLNQTHQLSNNGSKTCVTIQCYMYQEDDPLHYDYFDYLDTSGNKMQYTPDSDCDFLEFKKIIKHGYSPKTFKNVFYF